MDLPMTEFDPIFQWNMNTDEAEAFKLAVCYDKEFRRIFGEVADGQMVRRNTIPVRADPRRSSLFKHCWKMRRETRGLLDPTEYKNYIVGNLSILKAKGGHVSPNTICGDRAWVRYKVWKRLFDRKLADLNATAPPPSVSTTNPKVIQQIDRTKKFLFERCGGEPTAAKVRAFVESGIFKFWVAAGKVAQFYAVQSPWVAAACDVDAFARDAGFSAALARESVTQEVRDYFKHEYRHEYSS